MKIMLVTYSTLIIVGLQIEPDVKHSRRDKIMLNNDFFTVQTQRLPSLSKRILHYKPAQR